MAVLLDKWDILGFLLARGSVYSSGREGFGRCAGEELVVSRSGLTWASGTVRRFCCGENSLLQSNNKVINKLAILINLNSVLHIVFFFFLKWKHPRPVVAV